MCVNRQKVSLGYSILFKGNIVVVGLIHTHIHMHAYACTRVHTHILKLDQ